MYPIVATPKQNRRNKCDQTVATPKQNRRNKSCETVATPKRNRRNKSCQTVATPKQDRRNKCGQTIATPKHDTRNNAHYRCHGYGTRSGHFGHRGRATCNGCFGLTCLFCMRWASTALKSKFRETAFSLKRCRPATAHEIVNSQSLSVHCLHHNNNVDAHKNQ